MYYYNLLKIGPGEAQYFPSVLKTPLRPSEVVMPKGLIYLTSYRSPACPILLGREIMNFEF